MIVPQWVTDCGYTTLQTWFHLLRPLGRWLGSTTLIRLMNVKTQLVSQQYQWHTSWKSPWKKTKSLSYIHQEAFVTHVGIYEKSSSTVVVMCLEMWCLLKRMSARHAVTGCWESKKDPFVHAPDWMVSTTWAEVESRSSIYWGARRIKIPWKNNWVTLPN